MDELYSSIITAGTHKASSIKVAEAAKVVKAAEAAKTAAEASKPVAPAPEVVKPTAVRVVKAADMSSSGIAVTTRNQAFLAQVRLCNPAADRSACPAPYPR